MQYGHPALLKSFGFGLVCALADQLNTPRVPRKFSCSVNRFEVIQFFGHYSAP
jgi:hypothetical protein